MKKQTKRKFIPKLSKLKKDLQKKEINKEASPWDKPEKSFDEILEMFSPPEIKKTKYIKCDNFFELYKHPLWQKKRLEIMKRDNFTCLDCGNKEKELQIHHKYYEKETNPWDYPDDCYLTLCKHCHDEITNFKSMIKRNIDEKICSGQELRILNDIISALTYFSIDQLKELSYYCDFIDYKSTCNE